MSQSHAARSGSVIRVACQRQPARLVSLNPRSIQARMPYQQGSAALGGRSVRISQGSAQLSPQRTSNVQVGPLEGCPGRLPGAARGGERRQRCVPGVPLALSSVDVGVANIA